jgi:thiosulfate reductase cytochrome b subunit/cytochrome c553
VSAARTIFLACLVALAVPASAQQAVNPIHPAFAPLTAVGKPAARPEDVSAEKTCGACHDARWIANHSGHGEGRARATCIQCHVDGGRLDLGPGRVGSDGRLVREAIRIGTPSAASCARCHGVVADGHAAIALPPELERVPTGGRTWSLTLGEGAIVSPQRMSSAFLNLEGKESLASPWDVHAAKLVDCVACHYATNNPSRADAKKARLAYVTMDPRRTSTAEFLVRPDHRLAEPDCRACHDAQKTHGFLPYRERHMQVLACESCHAQGPMGPAAEMIDATVATAAGGPVVRYRNVERVAGDPLNASTVRPLRPLLVMRPRKDGALRLTPVNIVSRWRWISRLDGAEVPYELVARAFGDGVRPDTQVLAALDANRDGRLEEVELRLDTPAKVDTVAARLRALGVAEPAIDGVLEPHVLAHGLPARDRALRECAECHGPRERFSDTFAIAGYVPGGVPPRPPDGGGRVELAGIIVPTSGGGLELRRDPGATPGGLHVLGLSRQAWTNRLGFLLFAAVALGVAAHGLLRVVTRRRRSGRVDAHEGEEKEYVFGRYERLWHWTMAGSGVLLIATGVVIHNAGWSRPFELATVITVHNAAALVLMVNAFLSLFHHLTTAAIRHFIPHPHGLLERVLDHVQYQSRGIFHGDPHPHHPGHKLNPLQQVTYLGLLNVLFPLQMVTGVLIWAVGHWPSFGAAIGGLRVVAPLHNLGAWLFLAFFVLHAYLVTTGPTLGEHLRSMITGYRSVPADDDAPATSGVDEPTMKTALGA